MVYRRERPVIRSILISFMEDYGWNLQELDEFTSYDFNDPDWIPVFCLSLSMQVQLRKMIDEEKTTGGFFE